jgi:hypothetical protein
VSAASPVPRAEVAGSPLTVTHPAALPADCRSNLACSPKPFPSAFAKVLNMQRKGSNMLDVVGSVRPAGFSPHQCDAACGAW